MYTTKKKRDREIKQLSKFIQKFNKQHNNIQAEKTTIVIFR